MDYVSDDEKVNNYLQYLQLCLFAIWWSDLQFFQHRKRFMCSPIYYHQYLGNPDHKHVHESVLNISSVDLNLIFWALWNIGSNSIHWYYLWPLLVLCVSCCSTLGYSMYLILQVSQMAYYIFSSDICDVYCICHTLLETSTVKFCLDFYTVWVRGGVKYIWSGIVLADHIK